MNCETYRNALADLLLVINRDKDGSFFICAEAAEYIERAKALLELEGQGENA